MTATAATSARVIVVGSLNADLVVTAERLPGDGETVHGNDFARLAGGKGLNQAVAAARAGAVTMMIGRVGDDDLADFLREQASAAGVDLTGVEPATGTPSGLAVIMVDVAATNRIVVIAGANAATDARYVSQRLTAVLSPAAAASREAPSDPTSPTGARQVMLCQLETPMDGVSGAVRLAREHGAVSILNSAPAPAAGLPGELLRCLDWLIANEHEAALLLRRPRVEGPDEAVAAARDLQRLGPRGVVITLGERGAVLVVDDSVHRQSAFPVVAVDTTAAGDTFCGAFAAGLAGGMMPAVALRRACAAGALAAQLPGAVPSIPTAAQVDVLLATSPVD